MYSEEERKIITKIGYYKFHKLQKLNFKDLQEYQTYLKNLKQKKKNLKDEKDKIRYRTIRYVERYCNIDLRCQICGEKAEIHHPNYKDYLKVNFLCKKHHIQLHSFELIPPRIIDLEKIAIKKPNPVKAKSILEKEIENIKSDTFNNNFSYKDISEKYKISITSIKKWLNKNIEYNELNNKLKQNGKRNYILKRVNINNPFFQYKQKYGLSNRDISKITGISLSTINSISKRRTNIENIRQNTKQKLQKLEEMYK